MKCKLAYLCLPLILASSTVACLYQGIAKSALNDASSEQRKAGNSPEQPRQEQWVEITSPDGDFTASFPVNPQSIFKDRRETGPSENNHIFLAQHNGHTLMVSYMDITLSPGDKYDEVEQRQYREKEIIKSKGKEGWKVLSRTDLPGNGYQHIYFVPAKNPGEIPAYFRAITFVRGTRVYLITYDALTQSELFGSEARRFFDSFKFTKRRIKLSPTAEN